MARSISLYSQVLSNLKEKIHIARLNAAILVNRELLQVYFEIGKTILEQQQTEGWGAKIVDRLAADLKAEFPDFKGLSARNLKYMRSFAEAYPDFSIVQGSLAQLPSDDRSPGPGANVQAPLAQITWYHHITLLDKIKSQDERLFYIHETIKHGWSRNVMVAQVESDLYQRKGKAINNFSAALPKPQSDLAIETLKSPYVFDFLSLGEEIKEKELERALIQHIKKFMLELGRGFAYVGNQYNLQVDGDDFFLDLLFFNFHLNCFVVFELKVGDFKPEFAGKLNFYINMVDEKVKMGVHQPTIGVLLCKTPNDTVVKFALKGIESPVGVADYELVKSLPKKLKAEIPSVAELEAVIEKEAANLQKPIDKKLSMIKGLVEGMKGDGIKEKYTKLLAKNILSKVVLPLRKEVVNILSEGNVLNLFAEHESNVTIGSYGYREDKEAIERFEEENYPNRFQISISLRGFKKAATKAFNLHRSIDFRLEDFKYLIYENRGRDHVIFEQLYHNLPSKQEIKSIAETFCETLLDEIADHIQRMQ